jgi:hypothetical protein
MQHSCNSIHSHYKMPERTITEGGAKRHSPGPIGRDIHDPACELLRIYIPRTLVNKGIKKGRGTVGPRPSGN